MADSIKRRRRGFTLTEIAIVLGIIGVIFGAIWVAAAGVFAANRADQAVQDITTMATNIRSSYMAVNNFSSSTPTDVTASMVTAGVVPNNLIVPSTTTTQNAWGQAVTITFSSTDNRHFSIVYFGTPRDACLRMVSQLMNLGTADQPTAYYTARSTTAQTATDTATIDAKCSGNGTGGTAVASTGFNFTIH